MSWTVSKCSYEIEQWETLSMTFLLGSSGRARFQNLTAGYHILRVVAKATTGERAVVKRTIFICMQIILCSFSKPPQKIFPVVEEFGSGG